MSARMFVAVLVPIAAESELDEFLEPHRDRFPLLRWTRRRNWHVTLCFMARVPDATTDRLADGLDELASVTDPFDLAITGPGTFPDAARARHVWMDLDDPSDSLRTLSKGTRRVAQQAGISHETDPFRPHVTVARARDGFDAGVLLDALADHHGPAVRIDELALVESTLGRGPSHYKVVGRFPLGR